MKFPKPLRYQISDEENQILLKGQALKRIG